ncbi:hypothetical protein P7C70_g8949, partial [Phenoliferia sp. Uapishka_3]
MFTTETLSLLFPSIPLSILSELPASTSTYIRFSLPSSSRSETSSTTPPEFDLLSYNIGTTSLPTQAAQRLFAGLRYFDELPLREKDVKGTNGVDLILVESVEEEGVGVAVMERARKAAGGAEELEFLL